MRNYSALYFYQLLDLSRVAKKVNDVLYVCMYQRMHVYEYDMGLYFTYPDFSFIQIIQMFEAFEQWGLDNQGFTVLTVNSHY